MHDTAYRIGGLVMDTYLPSTPARILEIGAQNVNGTLRDHAPRNAEYVGLDFDEGDGVDIVVTGLADWNVPDAHFDLVMASSVFEHDKAFWRTFLAMCAKAKPGGHIYVSAPSNGTVHRYPQDYWRFYPDSGLALEELAREEGYDVSLVESFIAEREADVWNDFCAVFCLGASNVELNRDFVFQKVPSTNALTWRSSIIVNSVEDSEDTRLLRAAHEENQRWIAHSEHLNALHAEEIELRTRQIDELTQTIEQQAHRLAALDEAAAAREKELATRAEELASTLERSNAETKERERQFHKLAAGSDELRNRLAQREDQLEEAQDDIASLSDMVASAQDQITELERQNEWLSAAGCFLLERGKWWWRFMPLAWQRRRRDRRLLARNLFDSEAYSRRYPDVASSGQDPFRHFIHHGVSENRRYD